MDRNMRNQQLITQQQHQQHQHQQQQQQHQQQQHQQHQQQQQQQQHQQQQQGQSGKQRTTPAQQQQQQQQREPRIAQHEDLIKYIHEAWHKATADQGPNGPVFYKNSPEHRLVNFTPFDLDSWWGRRFVENLELSRNNNNNNNINSNTNNNNIHH